MTASSFQLPASKVEQTSLNLFIKPNIGRVTSHNHVITCLIQISCSLLFIFASSQKVAAFLFLVRILASRLWSSSPEEVFLLVRVGVLNQAQLKLGQNIKRLPFDTGRNFLSLEASLVAELVDLLLIVANHVLIVLGLRHLKNNL